MYRPTLVRQKGMITTWAGMRRILKLPPRVDEYYRQATESGTYRTPEEIDKMLNERRSREDPLKDIMKRFRQDIVRGAYITDYPDEYLILRQNPPVPDPPKIPVKQRKMLEREMEDRKEYVMKRLVSAYMRKQEQDQQRRGHNGLTQPFTDPTDENLDAPLTPEEYYRRLLGVPAPHVFSTNMGRKAAPLQKAYAAAVKHYELTRTEGVSDKEAMDQVDKILNETKKQEFNQAMETMIKAQKIRQKPNYEPEDLEEDESEAALEGDKVDMERIGQKTMEDLIEEHEDTKKESHRKLMSQKRYGDIKMQKLYGEKATIVDPQSNPNRPQDRQGDDKDSSKQQTGLESLYDNVLGSNPRVLEAMMRWSVRLREVPYAEWTIGASTALDHWIARQVLHMSEETWQSLLEGHDMDLLPLGRSIVQTREALFPETVVNPSELDEDDGSVDGTADPYFEDDSSSFEKDASTSKLEEDQSLEALLASLGDMSEGDNNKSSFGGSQPTPASSAPTNRRKTDQDMDELMAELQDYRRMNAQTPFDSWQPEDQYSFGEWFDKKFAPAMLPEKGMMSGMDMADVKKALLAAPAVTAEESDKFWSGLQTEQDAVKLLDQMRNDGPPPGASILQQAFWDLSYEEQLQQMLNLGAIRPLLDEYVKESDRLAFIQRYYDVLLTGVPLEYLVPDNDEGSITAADLQFETINRLRLNKNDPQRYKVQVVPFRGAATDIAGALDEKGRAIPATTQQLERSRALYKAWNERKANRASYEEEMFKTYRLGLRYGDEPLEMSTAEIDESEEDGTDDDKKV
mmetsp:Transcript_26078/g.71815  ORF Transcript_26078/g.71815 Transcript_26078/m.71815 type:complete len:799 (-) Transcript_26078:64-2460(-)